MHGKSFTHHDSVLASIASAQERVVTRGQLFAVGFGEQQIDERVWSGHLHVVHAGVYAVGTPLAIGELGGRRWAALLASGEGAALSHRSCAVHRNLLTLPERLIDVVVPTARCVSRPGIRSRRAILEVQEVELVRGLRCTSVARVLLELAATERPEQLERAWRRAIFQRTLDVDAIGELLERRRGERGTVRLRELYDRRAEIVGQLNGETEDLLLPLIRKSALGEPISNDPIWVGYRFIAVDFHFPSRRLVIEADSRQAHADPEQEDEDARRDRELRAIGKRVHRFTYDDARWRPHGVLASLNALAGSE